MSDHLFGTHVTFPMLLFIENFSFFHSFLMSNFFWLCYCNILSPQAHLLLLYNSDYRSYFFLCFYHPLTNHGIGNLTKGIQRWFISYKLFCRDNKGSPLTENILVMFQFHHLPSQSQVLSSDDPSPQGKPPPESMKNNKISHFSFST